MKITTVSILKKVRAPSRIEFRRGLWCETLASPRLLGRQEGGVSELDRSRGEPQSQPEWSEPSDSQGRQEPVSDRGYDREFPDDEVEDLHLPQLGEAEKDEDAGNNGHQRRGDFQELDHFDLLKVQFSTALLPQRLAVSCDSDNTANVAYMGLKVKPNRKSPYFRAFSRFVFWIKKFSSPKIKIWFEPMFFSGFFCGFERYGSAAFPNFRGGIFSEKCVRTNSRILHQKGKVKEFWFASLCSATNSYSILGVKTNSRFRILGEENFLILNPKTI